MDRPLNDKQSRFVEVYVSTLDSRKALKAAGYIHDNGSALLNNPRVSKAIQDQVNADTQLILAKGTRWALAAIDDKSVADGIKVKIWQEARKTMADGGEMEKEPHEMTAAELASMQDKIRAELAKLPDITPADEAPAIEHEKGDIFE